MGKQWVDITTIDNNTPFMRVRWRGTFANSGDRWFAESPGIVSDSMSWTNGTKDNGWFSAHRLNQTVYCCSFDFDHTATGFWDVSGANYRVSVKDTNRGQSGFYDTTVTINDETYYEVDFSLWQSASGYQLYAPFSNISGKFAAGDVYVEVGTDTITLNKKNARFDVTGGSESVVVTADDDWTATVSDSWISASTLSGGSGETTITVSAPDMTSSPIDRAGTIVFTCSGETVTLNVTQKSGAGVSDVYLGDNNIEGVFLGDLAVEALYLGENLVYSQGPFAGIKIKPSSLTFNYTGGTNTITVKSSESWTLSYDSSLISADTASGNSGETPVAITAGTNSTTADVTTVITAVTVGDAYSATTNVKIKKETQGVPDIPNNQVWYKTSDSANISASGEISTSNAFAVTLVSDVYDANEGYRIATFSGNITQVKTNGFKYNHRDSDIREIIFPPSVTSVGNYAFNQVSKLESIKFSNSCSITSLGHEAFCECRDVKEVRMPTVSGNVGFWSWMGLTAATAITFVQTSGVTTWNQGNSGLWSFANCPNLKEFMLPGNTVEFRLYDYSKTNYPTTSMTETAWTNLFDGLGAVNSVNMYIGPNNNTSISQVTKDIAINKGWTFAQ